MPVRPHGYICKSCRATTANSNQLCDDCSETFESPRKIKKGDPFYSRAPWLKFRDWYKKKHPLCEDCLERGRVVPVDVVDHIKELKDGGAPYSEDNARSLCNRCHARKTARVKREREGGVESPPDPPAQPFGRKNVVAAKLGRGGIKDGGSHGKG